MPENGLNTLEDWRREWNMPGAVIKDEYGTVQTPAEMEEAITQRSWANRKISDSELCMNYAERGPNGLLRSRIDGGHCVGHGEGTWDYVTGEFS